MILVDYSGHLVSTESEEELHRFAKEYLGMRRGWFQNEGKLLKHPHYDLTTSRMIDKALMMGARQVSLAKLVRKAWWSKRKGGAQ